jgi:hypothetical protein
LHDKIDKTGCFEENTDYRGGDLQHNVTFYESAKGCQEECQRTAGCNFWSWAKPSSFSYPKHCFLKWSPGTKLLISHTTSGPKNCPGG